MSSIHHLPMRDATDLFSLSFFFFFFFFSPLLGSFGQESGGESRQGFVDRKYNADIPLQGVFGPVDVLPVVKGSSDAARMDSS